MEQSPIVSATSHVHTAAPDPTAHLEEEDQTPSNTNSFLLRLGIPTNLAEAKAFGFKHYIIKTISILMILHSFHTLYENLIEIFFVFPQLPEIYKSLDFSPEVYNTILYKSLIITATGVIEGILGVSLALKHSKVIQNLHLIVGISLILISYYINNNLQTIDLQQHTNPGQFYPQTQTNPEAPSSLF